MAVDRDNLNRLRNVAQSGRLDELTPQEMAALEQHLNDDAGAAAPFRDLMPVTDAGLVARAADPTTAQWDAVWQRIESAGEQRGGEVRTLRASPRRVFPLYRGIAAVAACVGLLLFWRFGPFGTKVGPAETGWDLQLSASNRILELAMSGNASPTVHYDDDGIAVIDYHDADGLPEGASDEDEDAAAAAPRTPPDEPVGRVVR